MAVVTTFSIAERFLGFLYRIFLSRFLGAQGVGIYQIALSVFGVLITITASGIPITISRMIIKHKTSKNEKGINQTISAGILTALIFSLPVTVIFLLFKNKLGFLFSDKRCIHVLTIIMPTLVINSVYAVIKGSFWGNKNFFVFALVDFLEELVMLISGVMLITHATSLFDGVKRASWAVLISYVFSFSVSLGVMIWKKFKPTNPLKQLKPLLCSALPITAMRTTTSIINSLIAIILPARLVSLGLSSSQAVASFGEVSGMAIPMLFIPSSLIGSIALVLVPELSENYFNGQHKTMANNVQKSIKYSILIACSIIPVFTSCGVLVGDIIYSNINAGKYLSRSALMMLPMSISMITTSMLNSMGEEKKTMLYFFVGEVLLMLCIVILPNFLGAGSLIAGYYLSFTVSTILNLILLEKKCKEKITYKKFLIFAFIFLIPSIMLGVFVKNILSTSLNKILTLLLTCGIVTAFNLLFYVVFGLISIKVLIEKRNSRNRNKEQKRNYKVANTVN